jgi:hypothetical protein
MVRTIYAITELRIIGVLAVGIHRHGHNCGGKRHARPQFHGFHGSHPLNESPQPATSIHPDCDPRVSE